MAVALLITALLTGCSSPNNSHAPYDHYAVEIAATARAYLEHGMVTETVALYEEALSHADAPAAMRARWAFTLGAIHQDRQRDHQAAATAFLRARAIDERMITDRDLSRRLVDCWQSLGQNSWAAEEAQSADVAIDTTAPIVAQIGARTISVPELRQEFGLLPPEVRATFSDSTGMARFLHQFVGIKLLYQRGLDHGWDRDPDVQAGIFGAKRELIVQRVLEEDILSQIAPSADDLRDFHEEHRGSMFGGRTYEEVSGRVREEYVRGRRHELYAALIDRLIEEQRVVFHTDRLPAPQ